MLYRLGAGLVVTLLAATVAQAHFVFIVPDKDGKTAQVVFSDNLSPDENVPIAKIARLKLSQRTGSEKPSALDFKKEKHSLSIQISDGKQGVVEGSVEYGVFARKDEGAFLLRYRPRLVLGSAKDLKPDATAPIEILPVVDGGKVRFLVASKGKPLAETEVNVMLPGDKKEKVKTDAKGLTESFDKAGRYAAYAFHADKDSGERDGKKYEQVRTYATLVYDLSGK